MGFVEIQDAKILHECNPRRGWGNFFLKIERRSLSTTMKVAFLGGSVTCKFDCWRPQTMDFLRRLYPYITWEEINAAVGATGSDFGVFRIKREVLGHKPDLIFVEFALNDASRTYTVK